MAEKKIRGIQQVGIGVKDVHEAFNWYKKYIGNDIMVFEEEAVADLMLPYTGNKPHKRKAILSVNMQSGGGFEIWQYKDRVPVAPGFEVQLGDLGINVAKIKCKDIEATREWYSGDGLNVSETRDDPIGNKNFFLTDPYKNIFQLVPGTGWYLDEKKLTGSVYGVIIGVSDIDKAQMLYGDILGYDEVIYQKEGTFKDLEGIPGGKDKFKRVLLKHTENRKGGFSKFFGPSQIELVQVLNRKPRKIFEGRLWGDLGFIHLCYDIHNMDALKAECEAKGFRFTVDSKASHDDDRFDMGEAAGHFSYIEDPDGTLIEFVETLKVPLIKKLGLYVNLGKRNPNKDLPNWILKGMRFNRVR